MGWNIADIWETVAARTGDEPALLHGERVVSWSHFVREATALARFLLQAGATAGDKLAIYAYSRPEWMIAVYAAFKARLVPVNVNYRYRQDELRYLFDNSDAVAVVFEGAFAESIAPLRADLPKLRTFVQLDDGSAPAPWAARYADVVATNATPFDVERSGDDLLFIYTASP